MIPFARRGRLLVASFSTVEADLVIDLALGIVGLLDPFASSGGTDVDPLFAATGIGGSERAPADPAVARLLPNAHADDEAASADFRRLTERSLAERKTANAHTIIASLRRAEGQVELDGAEAQAWLRGLADIRLTIAARLGIETDDDQGRTETDQDLLLRDVYDWLAFVTESLIEALES